MGAEGMGLERASERIESVHLDEKTLVRRRAEVEHERKVAIYDLLEDNLFRVMDEAVSGPYSLHLSIDGDKLCFAVNDVSEAPLTNAFLSLKGFRSIVKEYFMICESYFSAIRTASPSQIEAIDMGRRGLHNDGAEMLRERLHEKGIEVDKDTARRLFTLVCVLHIRG
jgi:uncharacterized protein (UPF0262 family)